MSNVSAGDSAVMNDTNQPERHSIALSSINLANDEHKIGNIPTNSGSNNGASYQSHNLTHLEPVDDNHNILLLNTTNHHIPSGATNGSINKILTTTMQTPATTAAADESWLELPKMDNLVDIFSFGCSAAMIFGGLVPYIPQYLKIKRSMSSDGFSTYVCLTLLIANILRIIFWFGRHFEVPLLIQSFVMILGMLTMMEICVRVREKNSSYVISAIGIGANNNNQRRRRSLFGKRASNGFSTNENEAINGLVGDSTPIYSVLASPSSTSSHLSSAAAAIVINSAPNSDAAAAAALMQSSYQQSDLPLAGLDNNHLAISSDPIGCLPASSSRDPASGDRPNNDTHNSISSSVSFSNSNDSPVLSYNSSSQQCQSSLLAPQGDRLSNSESIGFRNKCIGSARGFWDWDDLFSYIRFLSLFTLVISLLTYLLLDNRLYIEGLGFVAVFTESMLGTPQLLRNYAKKSTRGMSVEMVIMWLSGDLFKTLYTILRKAPAQFYVCGSIQVIVDILILGQVLWYRRPNVTYRKLPKTTRER